MKIKYTAKQLDDFEDEIAEIYKTGIIRAPVHLRKGGGYSTQIIDRFAQIDEDDYVFSYWASHAHCLLKGVPMETLKQEILAGKSISLCFPKYKIFCSGIVGSLVGVAVGCAYAIKKQGLNHMVHHFGGDMLSRCGIFAEATNYANNHFLPIRFIVEDNGISVMTNTKEVWNDQKYSGYGCLQNIERFIYKNEFPHSGITQKIRF
jgi:pyruvate dehydrogenase E1 component alpha subunit